MTKEKRLKTEEEILREEIGFRIMALRVDKCYSRKTFSQMIGISSVFLYEIELAKKRFSSLILLKMAKELDVSTDYILTGKNTRKLDDEIVAVLEKYQPDVLEQWNEKNSY